MLHIRILLNIQPDVAFWRVTCQVTTFQVNLDLRNIELAGQPCVPNGD